MTHTKVLQAKHIAGSILKFHSHNLPFNGSDGGRECLEPLQRLRRRVTRFECCLVAKIPVTLQSGEGSLRAKGVNPEEKILVLQVGGWYVGLTTPLPQKSKLFRSQITEKAGLSQYDDQGKGKGKDSGTLEHGM